jgi:exosortase
MPIKAFLSLYAILLAAVAWAYGSTLAKAADRWASDPQYSHGYLVPLFALYMLYRRRGILAEGPLAPSWLAIGPLAVGLLLRFFETYYFYNGLDQLSMVPMALGAALAAGGRTALRWSWPAALFLVFMVPLPYRLQTAMSGQLQSVATEMSSFALVTAGLPAITEGNVIVVQDVRIGVVEACSGLGMGVTFLALVTAFVVLSKSAWPVRAALVFSALPIAVLANVARITLTAVLYYFDQSEAARTLYHDLAGWLMIPLGCAMILAESWFLDRLVVRDVTSWAETPLPKIIPPRVPKPA